MDKYLVQEKVVTIISHVYNAFNENDALEKFGQNGIIPLETRKEEHSSVIIRKLDKEIEHE